MLLGTQCVNPEGHLEIGGCDTVRLAETFGTPLYVVDELLLRQNCRDMKSAFEGAYSNTVVSFAGKALLTFAISAIIQSEGLHLDTASLGEMFVAITAGFPVDKIALHGNNKSDEELEYAVANCIGMVVLDHFGEIARLQAVAATKGITQPVMLRCTPGVDPDTHRYISTGQADTKFGFNIADGSAMAGLRQVCGCKNLDFAGIHCHIGSQLLDASAHVDSVAPMVSLIAHMRDDLGLSCPAVNLGGGLGVRYLETQHPPSYRRFADLLTTALRSELRAHGLPEPRLMVEPGRAIAAEAGTTLYRIGPSKRVPILDDPGYRTYVMVDGGLSDNPRPQLYDARYSAVVANRAAANCDQLITVAGKHCETDILIWNLKVPQVYEGDLLAVQTTGAYNYSMASNYNRFLRPAMVLVRNGDAELIVSREDLGDLVRHEIVPVRLQFPLQVK